MQNKYGPILSTKQETIVGGNVNLADYNHGAIVKMYGV